MDDRFRRHRRRSGVEYPARAFRAVPPATVKGGRLAAFAPLAVALLVRAVAIAASDRVVADVERYEKVGAHLLDVSWNPYEAARLYPYPPVWMWVEAACLWIARATGASFAVLVKLPVLAAELGIVALLARGARGGAAAWAYALHPVAILVSAFHGQFDSLALLLVLLALHTAAGERWDASALALAAAIAVKSFPVLLLPLLLIHRRTAGERVRFLLLSTAPVALLLVPFAVANLGALRSELFGYGGVADFGCIGAWRGVQWMATGALRRGEARHWAAAVTAGKVAFVLALAALVWLRARSRQAPPPLVESAMAVFLAFTAFYGALSAQYLLWVVPLAAVRPDRWLAAHAVAATLGLVGFYLFLAPGVLTPAGEGAVAGGYAWVAGSAAVLAVSAAWLVALVRRWGTPPAA